MIHEAGMFCVLQPQTSFAMAANTKQEAHMTPASQPMILKIQKRRSMQTPYFRTSHSN
jgi:hypothetical protein